MGFGKLYLTAVGQELQYKCQAGKTLTFANVVLGSGELGSQAITTLTDLIEEKMRIDVKKLKVSSSKVTVGASFNNSEVKEGFFFRELGIIAKDPDTNEDILYMYANAGDSAEYIDANTGDVLEKFIDIDMIISNIQNITAIIDTSLVYPTYQEFNGLEGKVEELELSIPVKTSQLEKDDVYTRVEIDAKVSSVYKYKGSVPNISSLPVENVTIGDVYNIEDTGMNVAWTGTVWDNLGATADLTEYLKKNGDVSDTTSVFSETESRANIISGEKLSVIFGKIKKFFTDLKTVAFTGSFADLTNKPTITTQTVVTNFWKGTQAEYDAITTKVATTLYLIEEE